ASPPGCAGAAPGRPLQVRARLGLAKARWRMSPRKKRRKQPAASWPRYVAMAVGGVAAVGLLAGAVWFLVASLGVPWQTFDVPGGGCTVEVPGGVTWQESHHLPSPFGAARLTLAVGELEAANEQYMIAAVDVPMDRVRSADVKTLLQDAVNGMVRGA